MRESFNVDEVPLDSSHGLRRKEDTTALLLLCVLLLENEFLAHFAVWGDVAHGKPHQFADAHTRTEAEVEKQTVTLFGSRAHKALVHPLDFFRGELFGLSACTLGARHFVPFPALK